MLISINTHLKYTTSAPCSLLLQIEAVDGGRQTCTDTKLITCPNIEWIQTSGEEAIGVRRWGTVGSILDCTYQTNVEVHRHAVDLSVLQQTRFPQLSSDVIKFLLPSRYCHPEAFIEFVAQQFGRLSGGPFVAAASDWIHDQFTYDNGASNSATTATESFHARAGVCRDFAHVLIAMARCVGIPARIVSAYAPDVIPQDFHALAEVFLDGDWHIVDPTGMASAEDTVRIGVGRDAADVSFMTSFGWMELIEQSVEVSKIG